jgi:hypothetical protein
MEASGQHHHRLFLLVREFAERAGPSSPAIRYHTKPDEVLDLTLAAQRALGSRGDWLVIQAAAGLDSPELPMPEQTLTLPTPALLAALKVDAGFPADYGLV